MGIDAPARWACAVRTTSSAGSFRTLRRYEMITHPLVAGSGAEGWNADFRASRRGAGAARLRIVLPPERSVVANGCSRRAVRVSRGALGGLVQPLQDRPL